MASKSAIFVFLLAVACRAATVASTASASFVVSTTVAASCSVSAPASTPAHNMAAGMSLQSGISVACTSYAPYTVALVQRQAPPSALSTPSELASCSLLADCNPPDRLPNAAHWKWSPLDQSPAHAHWYFTDQVTANTVTAVITY